MKYILFLIFLSIGSVQAGWLGTIATGAIISVGVHYLTKPAEKKPEPPPIERYSFANIAGVIPQQVQDIVSYINDAGFYKQVGARMPRGTLLIGPPGTGKTSIARAIAGEVGASFYQLSAASLITFWQGSGPAAITRLFTDARSASVQGGKVIVFIDEIDAIISRKGTAGSMPEHRNTLNELLYQMSLTNDNIFIIAATNRPLDLDDALIRPGRFDRIVCIDMPDKESRGQILQLYLNKLSQPQGIDIDALADRTEGWTPAALEMLINEAALIAVRNKSLVVTAEYVNQAYDEQIGRFKL